MDPTANPNSPFPPPSSSWGDGGSISSTADEIMSGAQKRPPPALSEPAYKKAKPDLAPQDPEKQGSEHQASSDPSVSSGYGSLPPPPLPLSASATVTENHGSVEGSVVSSYKANRSTSGYGGAASYESFNGSAPLTNTNVPTSGGFAPGSAKSSSGTGALFYKTKICTKFKLGSCTFNERCHFAHGEEDLRRPPQGWEEMMKVGSSSINSGKLSMEAPRRSNKPCRYFAEGNCPYGDRCTFSHGNDYTQRSENVLVSEGAFAPSNPNGPSLSYGSSSASSSYSSSSSRTNYKTRICARWEKGEVCSYGDKCHFAHGQTELRPYSASQPVYNSGPGTVKQIDPYANVYSGMLNSYGNEPVMNTSGYSTTYNYWNTENSNTQSYIQPNMAPQPSQQSYAPQYQSYVQPTPAIQPNQGYVQPPPPTQVNQNYTEPNPMTPWAGSYSTDGGYAKNESNPVYYIPDQPQQQQPSVSYYGNVPSYQGISQTQSYLGDGSQANYQGEAKNGDSATYYNAAAYPTQQTTYIGSYNTT